MMVELNIPWESRCEQAYERKSVEYTEPWEQIQETVWKAWFFPVDM